MSAERTITANEYVMALIGNSGEQLQISALATVLMMLLMREGGTVVLEGQEFLGVLDRYIKVRALDGNSIEIIAAADEEQPVMGTKQ